MRKNLTKKYFGFIRKNEIMVNCVSLALGAGRCGVLKTDKAFFGASSEDVRAAGHYIA